MSCGACISVCPDRILQLDVTGKLSIQAERCMICGHCYAVCPVKAITVPSLTTDLGLVSINEKRDGPEVDTITPQALLGLMRNRRSCRKFKKDPPDLSLLTDLVRIGTTAPSGTNSQGWQFIILPERADVIRLGEATADFYRALNKKAENPLYRFAARMFAGDALGRYYRQYYSTIETGLQQWDGGEADLLFHGAPAAILVAADTSSSCPAEDSLLATQNILLAAESLGLGTCLIGFVVEALKRDKKIPSLLRLGRNEQVFSVIACGYPAVSFQRPAGRKAIQPRILKISKERTMKDNRQAALTHGQDIKRASLVMYSFGFKHGVPVDANMVWDVRFLPNPYWQEDLRPLTGCETEVADYVVKSKQGKKFLKLLKPLLLFLIDTGNMSERKNMRLAVGCTGGRHRSVAIVEALQHFLAGQDVDLRVFHRDMDRESRSGAE